MMAPEDRVRAQTLLAGIGASVDASSLEPFWRALEQARRRWHIRLAARSPRMKRQNELTKAQALAMKLRAALQDDAIQVRLAPAFPLNMPLSTLLEGLDVVIAETEQQARQLDGEPVDFGSPGDCLIREGLASIASEYLGIAATAPGDPPGGPFVAFVTAVFAVWGERPPTADSIKSSLYRA